MLQTNKQVQDNQNQMQLSFSVPFLCIFTGMFSNQID